MKRVLVIFAVMGLMIGFLPCSQANPPEGLVLHLSFDERTIQGDTAKDQSQEGNDGIINGGAKTVAGKHGEALELDVQDEVSENESVIRRGYNPRLQ